MKNYSVVFTGEGFNHNAFFQDFMAFDLFARLMAADGRLMYAKVGDKDVTEEYVTLVHIN